MPKDFVSVDFTVLSEPQIIQIQKFFIKKLIEKLPKWSYFTYFNYLHKDIYSGNSYQPMF